MHVVVSVRIVDLASMSEVRTIVGVLAEVRRTDSKGYFCSKCTVMGIDEAEHGLFRSWRVGIYPRVFVKEAAKYQVDASAWTAMRVLASVGYSLKSPTPRGGERLQESTGDRRLMYYTLENVRKGELPKI